MKQLLFLCIFIHLLLTGCERETGKQESPFRPIDLGKAVNVSCFEVESNGALWLGLDGEGIAYKESMASTPVFFNKMKGSLPADVVLCSYRDRAGRLWFGTFGDGMFYWADGDFHLPAEVLRTKELQYVGGFTEDQHGRFWIATLNHGLACLDTLGNLSILSLENSELPTNTIVDLKTFDGKTIYVATGWGLMVLNTENDEILPITDSNGHAFLQKQLIRHLYPAPDGQLWIGTRTGLYIYNKESHTYTRLTIGNALADNYIKAIGSDGRGTYWATSEHEVTEIVPRAEGGYHCRAYRKEDGLEDITFHVRAIACNTDGKMLIGTSKGVLAVSPQSLSGMEDEKTLSQGLLWAILLTIATVAATIIYLRNSHKLTLTTKAYVDIEPSKIEITPVDEQLKEKALRTVEAHIDNTEFSVEQLAKELGLSRGHLYKRLTAITGKTPIEFIRTIRIKTGHQLLEQSGESISLIAWHVGMSPKQFSHYFKKEYGMLPTEFLAERKAGERGPEAGR